MELNEIINRLAGGGPGVLGLVGKVIAVDADAFTCDVQPAREDEPPVYAVRILPTPGQEDALLVMPKVGSLVVLGMLSETSAYVVLMQSPEYIQMKVGSSTFLLNSEGVKMERNGTSLLGIMESLVDYVRGLADAVALLTVLTPAGPSSVPANVASFQQLSAQLVAYKNELQTLLK